MKKIAVIGLEKNGTWDFFKKIGHLAHANKFEFVPFIYSHKRHDLYDRLDEKGYKAHDFTAAVSVGGDGTFLYVSRVFAGTDVPLFGINKGHFGFNTNIEEDEFGFFFDQFVNNTAQYDYKNLIDITIEGDPTVYSVLNEGVISHTGISRMIRLKVKLEGVSVCDFRGDGLIVSSPTGSTAYNLSAGGPIMHPSVDAFVVCPICPHTLAIRPYIIPFNEVITISVEQSSVQPQITLDGQKIVILEVGKKIEIRKSSKKIKIIRGSKNFSEILEKKLGWKV